MAAGESWTTSDLDLAAWVQMKAGETGIKLISARRLGHGRFEFTFDDPSGKAQGIAVGFAGSEASRHANEIRVLKKLTYARTREG